MNKCIIIGIFSISFLFSTTINANEFTWQAGYGSLTSGFGIGVNYEVDNYSLLLSGGCAKLQENEGVVGCGIGTGIQWFPTLDKGHSFGVSFGNIDTTGSDTVYGGSINYTYFLNGKNKSGFFAGCGYKYGEEGSHKTNEGFLNVGYKF